MQDPKNKLVLALSGIILLLVAVLFASCASSYQHKAARQKEMSARFDLEEKLSKISQQDAGLEQRLKTAEKELEAEKAALDNTKKALMQEQLISQSLKEELEKVTRQKESLEAQLAAANAAKPVKR